MTRHYLNLGVLAAGLAAVGCGGPPAPTTAAATSAPATAAAKSEPDDHDHGEGPHGGTVIEFGKYHGEFVVDHDKKEATVYILDGRVKYPAPIAAEKLVLSIKSPAFQTDLLAVPQKDDPAGKSSRFVGTHENLGKVQEFEGTVSGEVNGKPYLGDFQEQPHADPKHEKK